MPPLETFFLFVFFFSSRRRHTRSLCDWSSDVCSSDLQSVDTNSGSQAVIDPQTGTVYVVWRRYADPSAGTGDALWMSYSSDGGNKWVGPTQVASIIPYDQGSSGTTFRTNDTPAIAVSVDSTGTSRLHVAFSQRKAAINPVMLNCTDTTNNN